MDGVKDIGIAPSDVSLTSSSAAQLSADRPELATVIERWRIPVAYRKKPLDALDRVLPDSWFEDRGIHRVDLTAYLESSLSSGAGTGGRTGAGNVVDANVSISNASSAARSIRITGGRTKTGESENLDLEIISGMVLAVVGPTGAGKSRFLADIECLAQGDTPSHRVVSLDGRVPDPAIRYAAERRPVALLSQTMNFVMDLPVSDFLAMHAECRGITNPMNAVRSVLEAANDLAGEKFDSSTPLTSLSGGQSRALMIADTALLSESPIVLIDEIENAGVDRRIALDLFLGAGKIVVLSTHDPVLALLAGTRLVIRGGGVREIYKTSEEEKECLVELERYDNAFKNVRNDLRQGRRLDFRRKNI